jgi:hypothetical protein
MTGGSDHAGLASRSTSRDWSGLGSRTSTQGSGSFWAVPDPDADDRALLAALAEAPEDASNGVPGARRVAPSAGLLHSSRRASSAWSSQPSPRGLETSRSPAEPVLPATEVRNSLSPAR